MKLNKKQIEFLNKYTIGIGIGTWTLNEETGLVDIEGDFYCSNENLTDFKGVKFGVVTGNFDCSRNSLTSLEGAPQKVGGYFDCSNNTLTSLEGAPQKVGGGFYCDNNPISEKTLKLVLETMQEKKIDYWFALSLLKSRIKSRDWKGMSRGLDEKLSRDTQKGISMLDKFRYFD